MISAQCEKLRTECLEQAINAREAGLPEWEQAQMRRLHCLGNMKERIMTREEKEQH